MSAGAVSGPASLVSKEPGELATIYINEDLTVIGKLETACDAVISLPTVSRIHDKIKKKGGCILSYRYEFKKWNSCKRTTAFAR